MCGLSITDPEDRNLPGKKVRGTRATASGDVMKCAVGRDVREREDFLFAHENMQSSLLGMRFVSAGSVVILLILRCSLSFPSLPLPSLQLSAGRDGAGQGLGQLASGRCKQRWNPHKYR
jgi:hypothetical protein